MNKEINIMKTITKKLSLVLMLVIGIIGCFTLFACGEDPDTLPAEDFPSFASPKRDMRYTLNCPTERLPQTFRCRSAKK